MSTDSVSRKQLILEIKGKHKIPLELKRHLSPRTVGIIMRSLPLEGNAHFLGNAIAYFETSLDSGIERPKNEFKKGDAAFLSSSGGVCFFINDITGKTMTPIGKITDKIELLQTVKPGDIFMIYEKTG